MGYRSEVVISIQMDNTDEKSVKDWHLFISELKTNNDCAKAIDLLTGKPPNWIDKGGIDMENCSLLAYWENTKWYDDYDEVQSFRKILAIAQEYIESNPTNKSDRDISEISRYSEMSATFKRVGEEQGDVQEENYGEFGCSLAYITVPVIEFDEIQYDNEKRL